MHLLFHLLVLCLTQVYYVQPIKVDLPVGSILGKEDVTAEGTKFYSFLGIPYGEAPIGNLRFQAPVEKASWKGSIDATKEGNRCYQMRTDNPKANEDCLIINVYIPANKTNEPLPVMFYIYGGGFISGYASPDEYAGDHFVDKGVILVTFNYRMGPFGFLSFGDNVLPGNAGLKDQLLALKWTNKYIQYFGGDPDEITIFGESAGAGAVAYHLLSRQSSGLYKAAMMQSGSSLCNWGYQRNSPQVAHMLAQRINDAAYQNVKNSSVDLLEFLQSLPAGDVLKAAEPEFPNMASPQYNEVLDGFPFTPTIEPEHEGAFITDKMYGLLESGSFNRVPIVMGFNSFEWGYLQDDPNFNETIRTFDEDIKLVVPKGLNAEPEHVPLAAKEIYNFYTDDKDFRSNNRKLVEYFSDQGFIRAIRKHAELASKYTDVYFYQFSYKGRPSGVDESVVGFSDSVYHAEDLYYLFPYNNVDPRNWSEWNNMDRTTGERMITMWTNFAKYRNPTPVKMELLQNITWPKFDSSEKYLDIGSSLVISDHPREGVVRFWEDVYAKYSNKPFDTY